MKIETKFNKMKKRFIKFNISFSHLEG